VPKHHSVAVSPPILLNSRIGLVVMESAVFRRPEIQGDQLTSRLSPAFARMNVIAAASSEGMPSSALYLPTPDISGLEATG
jgi:hypothetical protein